VGTSGSSSSHAISRGIEGAFKKYGTDVKSLRAGSEDSTSCSGRVSGPFPGDQFESTAMGHRRSWHPIFAPEIIKVGNSS
jgi:hypothetical protein